MNAADVAERLQKAKREGAGWKACCPAHDDHNPSLSINDGEKGVLVKCWSGCSQESVLNALEAHGIEIRRTKVNGGTNGNGHDHDPTPFNVGIFAAAKKLPEALLAECYVHDEGSRVAFEYLHEDGSPFRTKYRAALQGKSERGFRWSGSGKETLLYGLWRKDQMLANDGRIILCEGESDTLTLWNHGFTAFGVSGADGWNEEWVKHLPETGPIYVMVDADDGGKEFEKRFRASKLAPRISFVRFGLDAKDPSVLHCEGPNEFVERFESRLAAAIPAIEKEEGLAGINFADMSPHLLDSYIVKDILPSEGEASIIGASGSGKTFLATDLALHIADNRPWRGIRVRGGLVVYVGVESPRSVERRFYAARHAGSFPASTPIKLTPGPINMLDDVSVTKLIEFCRAAEKEFAMKCVAVFVDTLARAMSGGEENSNDTMSMVTRTGCDRIRDELKATVVVIHHMGKDLERGSRGGSAFPAAMDAEIAVTDEQGTRIATIKKARDGESGARHAFKLKKVVLGVDEDGDEVTTCLVDHIDAAEVVMRRPSGKYQLQLLAELERRTDEKPLIVWTEPDLREIARQLGHTKNTAREAVFGLKRLGYFLPSVGGVRLNYSPKSTS